jgi:hypothetical protein
MVAKSSSTRSLGILSVATNVYLRYWMDLAQSIDRHVRVFDSVTLHVFTDQVKEAREFARTLEHCSVKIHEIEPLRWPDATLLRFKIFSSFQLELKEHFLMYLDADSVVDQDFEGDLSELMEENEILLVEQSGSWRPRRLAKRIRFYTLHPGAGFADVKKLVLEGGLGTWEKNPKSLAYVPRALRKKYVYGAIWMGLRQKFIELVEELSERVGADTSQGITAKWHDESHINWWSAAHNPYLLDPRYYFFPGQRHLDELPCIIRMVHKVEKTR